MHAPEPSPYLRERAWFACPNCCFPLRCGFLECPMCGCLFLFPGEDEPSQNIPKALATLKAYAGPARGEREGTGAAGSASSASGGATGSVFGLAAAGSDVTFAPLVTDKLKAELRAQKLEVFSGTVHKRGTW